MANIVFDLHAYASSPSLEYHPWLKTNLENLGYIVEQPIMDGVVKISFADWNNVFMKKLEQYSTFARNQIIFTGRSLGTWNILKYAIIKKVNKIVLVCPVSTLAFSDPSLRKNFQTWNADAMKTLDAFVTNNEVDYRAIEKNVDQITIFLSDNDPHINFDLVYPFYKTTFPKAKIITMHNAGHFNAYPKEAYRSFYEFPELLSELITNA